MSRIPGLCRGVVLTIAGTILISGCASEQQRLTLTSTRHNQTFLEPVSRAYAMQDGNGDTDVVLLDRAAQTALEGRATDAPVRQVLHIRILWRPGREMKANANSASNATVHWYVMGGPDSGDVLEYAGTAFVTIDRDEQTTELTIRKSRLSPVACRGNLCDPVGPSSITGTIRAANSSPRVRQALSIVRTAVAAAKNVAPYSASPHAPPEQPSSSAR